MAAAVWAALKAYPAAQPPNWIEVRSLDHVIFLRGQVDTDSERLTLEEAAREVTGVTRIDDLISLSYAGH